MNRFSPIFGGVVLVLWAAAAAAETSNEPPQPKEIPLDQIWGYNLPGTRDLARIGSDRYGSMVYDIRRAIGFPPENKEAEPAFAVSGTELDALREVHAVLVDKNKPRETFPAGSKVFVVFFSHETNSYVHLRGAECNNNVVSIRYRFVPHETEETTRHLALIPLGKLPSGKYRVNIIRCPMPRKYIDSGFQPISDAVARRIVCGSFSFSVLQKGE